jgi:hypothetical protein
MAHLKVTLLTAALLALSGNAATADWYDDELDSEYASLKKSALQAMYSREPSRYDLKPTTGLQMRIRKGNLGVEFTEWSMAAAAQEYGRGMPFQQARVMYVLYRREGGNLSFNDFRLNTARMAVNIEKRAAEHGKR